nr:MAG TPA: hypothetical protein [Caudoviricetes sp.]
MLFYCAYNHAKKRAIRLNATVNPKISAEMPVKGSRKPQKGGKTKAKRENKGGNNRSE